MMVRERVFAAVTDRSPEDDTTPWLQQLAAMQRMAHGVYGSPLSKLVLVLRRTSTDSLRAGWLLRSNGELSVAS